MCGLVAAQLSHAWIDEARLNRALRALSHRGPDGASSWFSPDHRTVLGHVRLSIIGINNGTQPIGNERDDLKLVVNGEFYGYRAIRDELCAKGYRFSTDSDSEIALHLFDEMGTSFAERLRGEFALVIADRRSGELIGVRDRFGIKPLFYAVVNGDVIFASEIKALLAMGVPARWNDAEVIRDFALVRTNGTMFADIFQVPPGCMAIAKNGKVRIERYWDIHYPEASVLANERRSPDEVIAGFRAVLDDAVAERLIADVEVACYLSGGLDSSAVLGLAQARLDRPIRAFTIGFEGAWDETAIAERTAAFNGSTFIPIPVTSQDLADSLVDAVWFSERTLFNGNSIAKFLLSRAVRDAGIKVVFTGEGSDEMLAGYPMERRDNVLFGGHYSSEDERRAAIDALIALNPLTKGVLLSDVQTPGTDFIRKAIGFCPSWISTFSASFDATLSLMRPDFAGEEMRAAPYRAFVSEFDVAGKLLGRDAINISLYLQQKAQLANFTLTALADRMEMAHSIEGRVPFLDHHVAAYAAGIPIEYKINGLIEKYVLREATRDVLTDELYHRQKHPFMAPPVAMADRVHADPLREMCEEIIRSPQFADQPFFDQTKVCAWLDALPGAGADAQLRASGMMFRLATFSVLQQRFGVAA